MLSPPYGVITVFDFYGIIIVRGNETELLLCILVVYGVNAHLAAASLAMWGESRSALQLASACLQHDKQTEEDRMEHRA